MAELVRLLLALAVGGAAGAWAVHARGLARGAADAASAPAADVQAYVRSVAEFADAVAPVWSAQIDSSRTQMEQAVNGLAEQFAGIVENLDDVLQASDSAVDGEASSLFDSSRRRLDQVVNTLDQALEIKRGTLADLRSLLDLNAEMKQMTAEVRRIAGQTHLLALNAAIEAVHVGAAGQAFGVVAVEVRQLADQSAATGDRIAKKATEIGAAIDAVLEKAQENAEHESVAVSTANGEVQAVLDDLLEMVSGMRRAADRLGSATSGVQSEVASSLVDLQFQDRICQMLEHLRDSVSALPGIVAASGASMTPLDPQGLLADLASSYTMQDEHLAHTSGGSAQVRESEITFF